VRFPDHEAAQKLISLSSGAVAAPSANPFGSLSPTRAEHVRDSLGGKVDIILDGGPTRVGIESTVIGVLGGEFIKILRPGGIPREAIENHVGAIYDYSRKNIHKSDSRIGGVTEIQECEKEEGLSSPGQLESHYAPGTPLFVFEREEIVRQACEEGTAFLFFDDAARDEWERGREKKKEGVIVKVLSGSGSLSEAAACLFESLHELDKIGVTRIFAQFTPQEGLGAAINDRLRRAAISFKRLQ
jgi:L-threonylcarbamoyladenylate synthase